MSRMHIPITVMCPRCGEVIDNYVEYDCRCDRCGLLTPHKDRSKRGRGRPRKKVLNKINNIKEKYTWKQ